MAYSRSALASLPMAMLRPSLSLLTVSTSVVAPLPMAMLSFASALARGPAARALLPLALASARVELTSK
ncbi:hypothetical protein FQZ97_551590 [compost metagenome]